MFLRGIEKNTQRCGNISKKDKRRKNADLHYMLKTKEANGALIVYVQNM